MRTIRVLIADDEPLARELLKQMLAGQPGFEVAGESGSGRAAVRDIRRLRPDLVLLDVQMPGKSGFDVLRDLSPEELPCVIFVTAYDQYALRAFEVHALDYLLKPFDEIRFMTALERAREHFGGGDSSADTRRLIDLLESMQRPTRYLERYPVRAAGRTQLLPVDEIDLFTAALQNMERGLNPSEFLRVSRSAIVNVASIREVRPWTRGEYLLILANGERVHTTRSYRDGVANLIGAAE